MASNLTFNEKIFQNGSTIYAASTTGNDSYTVTLVPAISSYATGLVVNFKVDTANTGTASLNVNGLGAKTIKKASDQDLVTGDIKANQVISVIYDGTNFQMQSQTGASLTASALSTAWVKFNGASPFGILSSYNVSSVTDNGVGDYTINFSSAFANANYCFVTGIVNESATANGNNLAGPTTTTLPIRTINTGVYIDSPGICVAIFGGS